MRRTRPELGVGVGVARYVPDFDVAVRIAGHQELKVLTVGAERRDAGARSMSGVVLRHQLTLGMTLPEPHPTASAGRHQVAYTAVYSA